ncbi:MAG: DUF4191 domain-containing protein [Corynebacterium sp.]|nr:DUF4191 domain-containing protein [Corynebacterium sp.]
MADDFKKAQRAAKKEARANKRAERKSNRSQMWQAFNMQRKQDKALIPLMLAAIIGVALLFFLLGTWIGGRWFWTILGVAFGFMLAMFIFSRRLQASVYDRAQDQTGAAGWALENMRSGFGVVWRTKTAVAMTRQMDVLHRVVGVCGVVLVGEGNPSHLQKPIAQQRRRIEKLAPGVPVHVLFVGEGENKVPLKKLQNTMMKLPRTYKKDEVHRIANRIEAMDNVNAGAPIPKGPLPKGGRVSGMNRTARRNAQRNK